MKVYDVDQNFSAVSSFHCQGWSSGS